MKIAICLPGASFSTQFMECYTALLFKLAEKHNVFPIFNTMSHVAFVREGCLDRRYAPDDPRRVPFQGNIDYDYILWIDSDVMFTVPMFEQMLGKMEVDSDKYIICGAVPKVGSDEVLFLEEGSQNYMKRKDVEDRAKKWQLIELAHASFGFVLMKKGLLEKMGPPWFFADDYEFNGKRCYTIGEDVAFFWKARKVGFKIWGDPSVIVGHQKMQVF